MTEQEKPPGQEVPPVAQEKQVENKSVFARQKPPAELVPGIPMGERPLVEEAVRQHDKEAAKTVANLIKAGKMVEALATGEREVRRPVEEQYKERIREKIGGMNRKVDGMLEEIFRSGTTPEERKDLLKARIGHLIDAEPTKTLLAVEQREDLLKGIDASSLVPDEKAFLASMRKSIRPLVDLRISHAKEYEDQLAREQMEKHGFTTLNERISYSVGGDQIQLHLAESFEVKDQIEDLYKDALGKLVDTVEKDPNIRVIGGPSWLNATNTYGAMKERLGFTLTDATPEQVQMHDRDHKPRPIKNATMTREEFLARYRR